MPNTPPTWYLPDVLESSPIIPRRPHIGAGGTKLKEGGSIVETTCPILENPVPSPPRPKEVRNPTAALLEGAFGQLSRSTLSGKPPSPSREILHDRIARELFGSLEMEPSKTQRSPDLTRKRDERSAMLTLTFALSSKKKTCISKTVRVFEVHLLKVLSYANRFTHCVF